MEIDKYKAEITKVVEEYVSLYPDEFLEMKDIIAQKRKAQISKFSEIKDNDFLTRPTYEIPETLFYMLARISFGADQWWRSLEGSRWFANTFKAFKIPELI